MNHSEYTAFDSHGRRKYLTIGEGEDFLKVAAEVPKREKLFCQALFYTGCRVSELITITRADVDSPASIVRVASLKKRGKIVIRRVPVPEWLAREMLELEAENGDGLLWSVSRLWAWRFVKRLMGKAGIHGIHACPKGLRHGFGVRAAMANVPVHIIQRWMGHSSPETTAIYLDVKDEEERSMIARTWNF